jgi:hypothetical protein
MLLLLSKGLLGAEILANGMLVNGIGWVCSRGTERGEVVGSVTGVG